MLSPGESSRSIQIYSVAPRDERVKNACGILETAAKTVAMWVRPHFQKKMTGGCSPLMWDHHFDDKFLANKGIGF